MHRRRRHAREYALALEAAVWLIVARAALGVVPFHRVAAWTTHGVRGRRLTGADRSRTIGNVRWAVAAAAARLPGQTQCFPRALAAQAMLRRRGVASALTYGAQPRAGQLDAHVWLTAGADPIVGHEVASEYCPLAVYTNDRPSRVDQPTS